MSNGLPSFHAIYTVAGDVDLLRASIRSIYSHVSGITVVTGRTRDWMRRARNSETVVRALSAADIDPFSKISILMTDETNEARSRNRAMDFAAPKSSSLRVARQSDHDGPLATPDYFLIIDADEIYAQADLGRLRAHVATDRRRIYRVACVRYFKRWNYRIVGLEWATCVVRSDVRFRSLRMPPVARARRALGRTNLLSPSTRTTLMGFEDVPPEIAVFHHGSYVGPTERIEDKLASFGHSTDVVQGWLDRVWTRFSPDMQDLNPVYPHLFPSVEVIDGDQLPAEITAFEWPPEYLDQPSDQRPT